MKFRSTEITRLVYYYISQISTSVQAMNHLYTTVTPMPPVQILHQTSLALAIWVTLGMAPIVRVSISVTVIFRHSKNLNCTLIMLSNAKPQSV